MTLLTDQCQKIRDLLNRRDLTDDTITYWVRLAEERLNTELRVKEMIINGVIQTDDTIEFPEDILELESIKYVKDTASPYINISEGRAFKLVSAGELSRMRQDPIGRSNPFFSVVEGKLSVYSGNGTDLSATPPGIEITYYGRVTPLEDSANKVFTNFPSLYLYGPATYSAPHIKQDERIGMWAQMVTDRIQTANMAWQTSKWSGAPLRRRRRGFG